MVWPVTQPASGEARNAATCAISSGRPSRPNGMLRRIALYSCGLSVLRRSQPPPGNSIRAGRNAIDPDTLLGEQRGLGLGVFDDRRLDRAVGRGAGRGGQARDRGDVDDRAGAGAFQERQRRPDRPHGAEEIDIDAGGPAGLVMAGAEAGGVVDQDIDAAERGTGLLDVALNRRAVGEIADRGMRLDAVLGDLSAHLLQRLGAAGADRDRGARLGAGQRDRPPDAAAAAGHHRPLSG
jgi:hypothetical protein